TGQTFRIIPPGIYSGGGVKTRHSERAHLLFLDGHVEARDSAGLAQLGFTKLSNQEGQEVSTKQYPFPNRHNTMTTTIASLKRVALAVLCMLPPAHSFADPYYDWMNDYTGSEPNTLILWKFNVTGETNSHMRDSSGNNRNLHSNTK